MVERSNITDDRWTTIRIDLQPGEVINQRMVRFRTLGCLAADRRGELSAGANPAGIIEEMLVSCQ